MLYDKALYEEEIKNIWEKSIINTKISNWKTRSILGNIRANLSMAVADLDGMVLNNEDIVKVIYGGEINKNGLKSVIEGVVNKEYVDYNPETGKGTIKCESVWNEEKTIEYDRVGFYYTSENYGTIEFENTYYSYHYCEPGISLISEWTSWGKF